MASTVVQLGRRTLQISNVEKVLYPAAGFTKADVISYYMNIAPYLLPHLKDRPLTLKRYPNGVDGEFFYEKRCPSHRPDWMTTARAPSSSKGGAIDYCVVNEPAALAWVENLASLELHTLLSKSSDLSRPTMVVFDLDPGPPAEVPEACAVALRIRDLFEKLKLKVFVKHSGGKGLHLVVPLNTKVTFDDTKEFARAIARLFEQDDPKRVTSIMRKDARGGKVFIDWSQNDDHKTTVCVYSLRARQRPTVSAPLTWKEVEKAHRSGKVEAIRFEAEQVVERAKTMGDLFEEVASLKQKLPAGIG